MDGFASGALVSDPETRRALQLDTLSAILPMERRDRLAELLTDDDVSDAETSRARGHGRELAAGAGLRSRLPRSLGPGGDRRGVAVAGSESLAVKFAAHRLWDPAKRETDPQHGMPTDVAAKLRNAGLLRSDGPHAPSTVKRRLASWGTLRR